MTVWMVPPWGRGEPQEVEATPAKLVPLMVQGYTQCEPPTDIEEVKDHVDQ